MMSNAASVIKVSSSSRFEFTLDRCCQVLNAYSAARVLRQFGFRILPRRRGSLFTSESLLDTVCRARFDYLMPITLRYRSRYLTLLAMLVLPLKTGAATVRIVQ